MEVEVTTQLAPLFWGVIALLLVLAGAILAGIDPEMTEVFLGSPAHVDGQRGRRIRGAGHRRPVPPRAQRQPARAPVQLTAPAASIRQAAARDPPFPHAKGPSDRQNRD